MTEMTVQQAIQILVDVTSRWTENAEEAFARRINADDTDDVLATLIDSDQTLEDAIEVRDNWRAIEVVLREFGNIKGAPR